MSKLSFIVSADAVGIQMLVYRGADEIGAPLSTLASVASEASLSLVDGHGLSADERITVSGPWAPTNERQDAALASYSLGDAYACEGKRRQPRAIGDIKPLSIADMLRTLDAIAESDNAGATVH